MRIALINLFLFISLFSVQCFANLCVVISGAKKDHNGAFTNLELSNQDAQYGKFKCKVFNSWNEADAFVTKFKLPAGEQLLVIQTAHGGVGGTATCNSQEVTPEHIQAYLDKYSSKYKVGAIINSCFSGDLLKKKILKDAIVNDEQAMQNLCLVTSSNLGMVSYGHGILGLSAERIKGKNIEKMMLLAGDSELSSSLAWDGSGISDYWVNKDFADSNKILKNMSSLMEKNHCTSKSILDLCVDPNATKELVAALMSLQNEDLPLTDMKKNLDSLTNFIADTEKQKKKKPLTEAEQLALECATAVEGKMRPLIVQWTMQKYSSFAFKMSVLDEIKMLKETTEEFKKCEQYGKIFDGASVGMMGGGLKISPESLPRQGPLVTLNLDYTLFGDAVDKLQDFRDNLKVVEKYTNHVPISEEEISTAQVLQKLNNTSEQCDVNKDWVLPYVLGDLVLDPHYYEYESNPNKKTAETSPYKVIQGFKNASLLNDKMTAKRDKLRRKACREFTF